MLYAVDTEGERIEPVPGAKALCPSCSAPVRARCGEINIWHWAHIEGEDCDLWSEPETAWHRAYKLIVPKERREVRKGAHRADLTNRHGAVLELQHSTIGAKDITARETHYGPQMRWLFDARHAYWTERIRLRHREGAGGSRYVTFRWKHARRSITACARPVFLDLGQGVLLQVKKAYSGPPFGGWGYLHRTADLWNWMLTGQPPRSSLTQAPDGDTLRSWIPRYTAALTGTCRLSDAEATSILTESLMPPDGTLTADMLYALLHLAPEGTAPQGLNRLVADIEPTTGSRTADGKFIARCPRCADQFRGATSQNSALVTAECYGCGAGVLVEVR